MRKRLEAIRGFFPIMLLIGLFVVFAIIIFFCYGYTNRDQREVAPILAGGEVVTIDGGLQLSPVEQLSYGEDVKRFLNVYFTQKFANNQDKLNFVKLELERFTNYNIATEEDRVINERFLGDLRQLFINMQMSSASVQKEEADLLKLMNEIK